MNKKILDVAVARNANSLTFFIGTGFSKYITDGSAPSWIELLGYVAKKLTNKKIYDELFIIDDTQKLALKKFDEYIVAKILELELLKEKKDLRIEITQIIREKVNQHTINQKKLIEIRNFLDNQGLINIVTTNYDTIFSEYIFPDKSSIFIDGASIPKINTGRNIYHIHGCISQPSSILITITDYFNFLNAQNYFSRKFFTLLQETTVVILGYSLGDFNLNSILNEVRFTKSNSFRKGDIYYVTRRDREILTSNFYNETYGIQVIPNMDVPQFISIVDKYQNEANQLIDYIENIKEVIDGREEFRDEYIAINVTFQKILISLKNIGISPESDSYYKIIFKVLNQKKKLTSTKGAWEQYVHLAEWLIELGSEVEILVPKYQTKYLELVKHSLSTSSRKSYFGYSWNAWWVWFNSWEELLPKNQEIIKNLINNEKWEEYNSIEYFLDK